MDPDTLQIVLVIGFLILSLGIHEAAHAWVATLCGDTTARDMGRLTLNPVAHIDPFFTILLPAMLLLAGGPAFGGAKPVPVVYNRLRKPLRDMMFVAIAGPLSNLVLAILFALAWKSVGLFGGLPTDSLAMRVLEMSIHFNIILAVFNMIPVPPLDGSRVLAFFLPRDLREPYVRLETFGMLIVFGLLFSGILWSVLRPMSSFFLQVVDTVTGGVW